MSSRKGRIALRALPMLGSDALPYRAGPGGRVASVVVCTIPVALIAIWLQTTPDAVYAHYVGSLGRAAALTDQHLTATIIWCAGLPALAVPAVRLLAPAPRLPSWARRRPDPADPRPGPPPEISNPDRRFSSVSSIDDLSARRSLTDVRHDYTYGNKGRSS